MTEEQTLKAAFNFYMALANSTMYPENFRQEALNQATAIGMQLGYYSDESQVQQSDAFKAIIDNPNDLSGSNRTR